jgi:hypothetical protein
MFCCKAKFYGGRIESLEFHTQSFVIKVWIHELDEGCRMKWHGRITHVPSGENRYVRDLAEITSFIAPYLKNVENGGKRSS